MADKLIDAYTPHWEAWQLEQEIAAIEGQLWPLRERRSRLHGTCLDIPPTPPQPADGEEPLAEWELLLDGQRPDQTE